MDLRSLAFAGVSSAGPHVKLTDYHKRTPVRSGPVMLIFPQPVKNAESAQLSKSSSVASYPMLAPFPMLQDSQRGDYPSFGGGNVSRVLMWFQSDLRMQDNDALFAAVESAKAPGGTLIPLYSPTAKPNRSAAAAELRALLQKAGSDLLITAGSGTALGKRIVEIARSLQLHAVFFNRAALPDDAREQREVLNVLSDAGIEARGFWGNSLCELSSTTVNGKSSTLTSVTALVAHTREVNTPRKAPERLPKIDAEKIHDLCSGASVVPRIGGGTSHGIQLLKNMTEHSQALAVGPSKGQDIALLFKNSLDSGSISLRMCYARIIELLGKPRGYLFSELAFRSYCCSVLQNAQKAEAVHA